MSRRERELKLLADCLCEVAERTAKAIGDAVARATQPEPFAEQPAVVNEPVLSDDQIERIREEFADPTDGVPWLAGLREMAVMGPADANPHRNQSPGLRPEDRHHA